MIEITNTEVNGFETAIRGMRNPMNSWSNSDSYMGFDCNACSQIEVNGYCEPQKHDCFEYYGIQIGENDLSLMKKLSKAGSDHSKYLRMINVSMDINAPLYWWKEFDTYKVGTVANSTSTMHKLASTPITKDCFEMDDFEDVYSYKALKEATLTSWWDLMIDELECLRLKYNETKDKRYWKELIRLLPDSWLQRRTVTMNYENLLVMCSKGQRRNHKLTEWSKSFIDWARSLPYAQQLIFIDELEDKNV